MAAGGQEERAMGAARDKFEIWAKFEEEEFGSYMLRFVTMDFGGMHF